MASTGTGSGCAAVPNVAERGFVSFDKELNEAPWTSIATKADDAVKDSPAALRGAPMPIVVWKIRLRF